MREIRIRERLSDASELLIHDGKMLEVLLDWTPNVRMAVQELLGVVRSQPEVLRLA